MGNRKKEIDETVNSFNKESFIIENFRMIPSYKIKYNGRFFHCFRVERLIKSILFSRSWIDSSSKSDPPPDFHNEKHHIMMEIMRVDDGAGGKHSPNSFERKEKYMQKHYGKDYKKSLRDAAYILLLIKETI